MLRNAQSTPQNFLINIAIIEGRHFAMSNMDSAVIVRVSDQKKCTKIIKKTDCPFFNEVVSKIKIALQST